MPTSFSHIRATRAFTLVEVLVALAIVSIGMLVVIQAVGQTANNSAYLRDKTLAHWVAMNQLTLMRIAQSAPTKGTTSGEVEMTGQRWHWTAEVNATPLESMLRIDVSVRASDADEKSQLASVTGFFSLRGGKPGTLIAQFTPAVGSPTPGAPQVPAPQTPTPAPGSNPPFPQPGDPNPAPQQPLIR